MAYVSQDRKKLLAAAVAKVMPKDWKYTMRVRAHSTIVLTIRQAPVDLVKQAVDYSPDKLSIGQGQYYLQINTSHPDLYYSSGSNTYKIIRDILEALNSGNHDNSDAMTDYFDVGWYVELGIGEYNSPFLHALPKMKGQKVGGSWVPKPEKVPQWKLEKYLPANFKYLSAGKKAAATKKAKQQLAAYG